MAVNNQLNTATVPFPVFKNVINITSAQVLAMYTTPILIIPSQGTHKTIFVHDVFIEYAFNSIAYADGSGFILQYGNAGSGAGTEFLPFVSVNPNASSNDCSLNSSTPYTLSGVTSDIVNKGIYATTSINNFTAGNGTFRVSIFYTVVTTTA